MSKMDKSDRTFKAGDLVIYSDGYVFRIGKVKRVTEDGAFVWYHSGETASLSPMDCLHKLENSHAIIEERLGGDAGKTV